MTWHKEISREWLEMTDITSFRDIPLEPKTTNFWMLNNTIALHYSTTDNLWRFLLFTIGNIVRRSGETFTTQLEARTFFEDGKLPSWIKGGFI